MELRQAVQRALPYAFGIALLQIALSFVGMVLLVRYLPPPEYGVWTLLNGLAGPVELLVSFGFLMALLRTLPALRDPAAISNLVWSVLLRRLALAALVALGLAAAFPWYAARYELQSHQAEVQLALLMLAPTIGNAYLTTSLNALFEQRAVLGATLATQVGLLTATAVGISAGRPLPYFVGVLAVANLAQFALLALYFTRRYGAPQLRSLWTSLRESAEDTRFRRLTWLAFLTAGLLSTDVDRYLIGYFSRNVEVAIYAVATTIASRLEFFLPHRMLQSLIEPAIYRRYEEAGGVAGVLPVFSAVFKANYALAFLFVAIFLPLGGDLLRVVFGDVYDRAWAPTVVFLTFLAFNTNPLGFVINAARRPELALYSQLVLPLNFLLAWWLVPTHGALGMAAATGTTMVLKNGALFAIGERRLGVSIPWRAALRCAAAAALAAGAVRLVPDGVPLAVRLVAAVALYCAAAAALGAFEREDVRLAAGFLPVAIQRRLPPSWTAAPDARPAA